MQTLVRVLCLGVQGGEAGYGADSQGRCDGGSDNGEHRAEATSPRGDNTVISEHHTLLTFTAAAA